jgi:hypothetical protein
MLWSSFYPNETEYIPQVGDVVTPYGTQQPYEITKRWIDNGNAYLSLKGESEHVPQVRLEVVEWYPQVGDICTITAKPYLHWRRAYNDYELPAWTMNEMELLDVSGDMATVRPSGKKQQKRKVPLNCLRVLDKNPELIKARKNAKLAKAT